MQIPGMVYPGSSTPRQRGVSTPHSNQVEVESKDEDGFSALIFTRELEVFRRDDSGLSPNGSGLREDGSITLSETTVLDAHIIQSDRRELDSHLSAAEIYVPPLDYAGSVSMQDRQNLHGPIADVVRAIRDMMHSVLAFVLLYAVSTDSHEVYNLIGIIFFLCGLSAGALGLINSDLSFRLTSQIRKTLPMQLQIAGFTSQAAMQRMLNEAKTGKVGFNLTCKLRIVQQTWRGIGLRIPGLGVVNLTRSQYHFILDMLTCSGESLQWFGNMMQELYDSLYRHELLKRATDHKINLKRFNKWISTYSKAYMEALQKKRPFPNIEAQDDKLGVSIILKPWLSCYAKGISNVMCFIVQSIKSYEVLKPQWLYRTQLRRIREAIEQRHAMTSSNRVLDPSLCALRGLQEHHRNALHFVMRQFIAEGIQAMHYALQFGTLLEGCGRHDRPEKVDPQVAEHDLDYFKVMRFLSNLCLLGSSFSMLNVGYKIYYYRKLSQIVSGYRKIIQSESELKLKGYAPYERLKNDYENKKLFQTGNYSLSFDQVKMLARAKLIESHPMASCRLLIDMLQDESANYASDRGEFGPAWQTLRSLGVEELDIKNMQLATAEEATELLGMVLDVIMPKL